MIKSAESFQSILDAYKEFDFHRFSDSVRPESIEKILFKDDLSEQDFRALLSPAAEPFLEAMAEKAHDLTVRHFGKVMFLYTPLYLANYCVNECTYCGFNAHNAIDRIKLDFEAIEAEAQAITSLGHRHILLLAGEDRNRCSVEYIRRSIEICKKHFASISIEIYPLSTEEYRLLIEAGVENLTIYQETYNRERYAALHPKGPKRNFEYRLETPQRALEADIRSVNIGALFGLDDFRRDCFFSGLHAAWLGHRFPAAEISCSVPRMQHHEGAFSTPHGVTDANLVQMILALRLYLPRLGISISTREPALLRDRLVPLGVTKMSSGSRTSVGGYSETAGAGSQQFEIADTRSVKEIEQALYAMGYQPVYKDWERI